MGLVSSSSLLLHFLWLLLLLYRIFVIILPLGYHCSSFFRIHIRSYWWLAFRSGVFLLLFVFFGRSWSGRFVLFGFLLFVFSFWSTSWSSLSLIFRMVNIHLFEQVSFEFGTYRFKMHIIAISSPHALSFYELLAFSIWKICNRTVFG